jgi:CDP-glucose 4,6-dehydratase
MPESASVFYAGKTVLVTGHTGFKGGWLAAWLKLLGAEVVGFALPPDTEPNLYTAAGIGERMVTTFGDVRDAAAVAALCARHRPAIIIHAAAQALVRRSYRDPAGTYATNVMGTVNVLEAARQTSSVRAVVVVTSDKCYESHGGSHEYVESDCMGGHDPYSSSKGAAELVTAAYRRSFFSSPSSAAVASARAGNVIGGGDWAEDRLVPDIMRGIASGKPVVIRRPDSVRPWQHVLEPVGAYLVLARRLYEQGQAVAEPWNFGPRAPDAVPVVEVARELIAQWGSGELTVQQDPAAPHEAATLRLNCDKARTRLGWTPTLTLTEALRWTADWYRAVQDDPRSAAAVTTAQIQRYTARVAA